MEKTISPSRVSNIADLKLPTSLDRDISNTVYNDRMHWEPWIQSAENYGILRESLKKRRFRNIPMVPDPLHPIGGFGKIREPKTANFPKRKVMLKKKKN
jgi:hypothetical protein